MKKVLEHGDLETPYGFRWGPLYVERMATLGKRGRILRIRSARQTLDIHITHTGLFRIYRLNEKVWP